MKKQLISVPEATTVYVYSDAVHMGASFRKLSALVKDQLGDDPSTGALYVFLNKRSTYVKVLFWQHGGFCILAKKLDAGAFELPAGKSTIRIADLVGALNRVKVAQKALKKAA